MSFHIAPLGELCEIDRRGLKPHDPLASQLPYLGVENVGSGTGILNFSADSSVGGERSTTYHFDQRHVLYSRLRPYLNKVATPEFSGKCSTELIPLLPRKGVDRNFLAHLLRRTTTVDFAMGSVTGTRMPRTNMNSLMSMRVPSPSLREQQRIADILDRARQIGLFRTQTTVLLPDFVQALFIRVFGHPLEYPKRWRLAKLGSFCVLAQYGTSKKPNAQAMGIPVLRMGNVTYDGYLNCEDLKHIELTKAETEKYMLRPGDILFNRTNSKKLVGKTGIWDGRFNAVPASYFIQLRVDEAFLSPMYVWAFMNSTATKRRLFEIARGAVGQANLNSRELRSLTIPIPPVQIQRQYADTLTYVFRLRSTGETASYRAKDLQTTLASRLLPDAT